MLCIEQIQIGSLLYLSIGLIEWEVNLQQFLGYERENFSTTISSEICVRNFHGLGVFKGDEYGFNEVLTPAPQIL